MSYASGHSEILNHDSWLGYFHIRSQKSTMRRYISSVLINIRVVERYGRMAVALNPISGELCARTFWTQHMINISSLHEWKYLFNQIVIIVPYSEGFNILSFV